MRESLFSIRQLVTDNEVPPKIMNFAKWLARNGAPQSTARTQVELFKTLKARNPNSSVEDIIEAMISARFPALTNENEQIWMHQQQDKCLYTHVVNLLRVEADFDKLDSSAQNEIEAVVREELLQSGLGKEVIFGESNKAEA
jgi:hypothetical protein